jgi:dolichol kinase
MKHAGRKLYHSLGGLFLLGIYYVFGSGRAFAVYGLLFAGIMIFDIARLRIPAFNRWAMQKLSSVIRPGEADTLSGSPAYVLGVALTLYLFDPLVATAAILFLVFGDVFASIVGEAWGKTKFRDKSLEGTAAFVVAGFIAGAAPHLFGAGLAPSILVAGVVTAAAVEILTPRWLNDNLSIPLITAAVMTLLGGMAG